MNAGIRESLTAINWTMTMHPWYDPDEVLDEYLLENLEHAKGLWVDQAWTLVEEDLKTIATNADRTAASLLSHLPEARRPLMGRLTPHRDWVIDLMATQRPGSTPDVPDARTLGLFVGGSATPLDPDDPPRRGLLDAVAGETFAAEVESARVEPFIGAYLAACDLRVTHQRGHKVFNGEYTLSLIQDFPTPDPLSSTIPDYGIQGSAAGDLMRAWLCSALVECVRWPIEWSDEQVSRLNESLLWWHRPVGPSESRPSDLLDRPELHQLLNQFLREDAPILSAVSPNATPSHFPEPRLVKSHRQAEEYAADVMKAFGHANVCVTAPGADGGIDVITDSAVVQVKMESVRTARPVIQAIYGVAALEGRRAVCFSLAGYTRDALAWATRAGVACFEFAFDGSITSLNPPCETLAVDG